MIGVTLLVATIDATLPHPPQVSWIRDMRVGSMSSFPVQYFKVLDYDNNVTAANVTAGSSNMNFLANPTVTLCQSGDSDYIQCIQGGNNYRVTFGTPQNVSDPSTTILIKAKDSTNLSGYTSFTLRRDAANAAKNPPSIGCLPNYTIPLPATGSAVYQAMFVVGDLDTSDTEDLCYDPPANARA